MSANLTDAQCFEIEAHLMQELGLPVPGPGLGMQVVKLIEAIDRVMPEIENKRAGPVLEMYRESLAHVAGVWAFQQKILIDQMGAAIGRESIAPGGKK